MSVYEGGVQFDENWGLDIKADRTGDSWITVWGASEAGAVSLTLGPDTDELRELAGALVRCADAADEARQSYSTNSNGRH